MRAWPPVSPNKPAPIIRLLSCDHAAKPVNRASTIRKNCFIVN